jgi:organic radical activating enzyme
VNRQPKKQKQVRAKGSNLSHTLGQLIPFIKPKKDALLSSVRQFWRISPELQLSYIPPDGHPKDFPEDAILLRLESESSGKRWQLSLTLSESPKLAIFLRHVSGSNGIMLLLKKNIAEGVDTAIKETLREAWNAFFPFRMMQDRQYREVYSAQGDISGRIRIGYRCNQDCWFCWQGRRWPSPPVDLYHTWVDQMAELGVKALNITGGEPTTYAHLPSLIAQARNHKMNVSIQSNAIKLGRNDYLQTLIDNGLSFVMVSYHSADSNQSDHMTRAPKTHKLTQKGITNLAEQGVPFTLNCVVERTNMQGLPELAKDIVNRFVKPFPGNQLNRVSFSHPFEYFEGGWSDAVVSLDEVSPYLVKACRILFEAQVPFQVTGSCGFPLCIFHEDSDLLETQRILGFKYEESEVSHRIFAETCDECEVKASCHGIRRIYREQFGLTFLQPIRKSSS